MQRQQRRLQQLADAKHEREKDAQRAREDAEAAGNDENEK